MKISCWSLVVLLAFSLPPAALAARAQPIRAWVGSISIPTYKLGPPDPNPPFPLVSRSPVYPYTMLNDLTSVRTPVTYRAIYLENQYLKITILPQLGGHVYSVYDKVDHREVLYRNHVIKYGLVGPRGAWISGGIEFSFPFAHTNDSVSPVESTLVHNPDGSATAYVGALDWVSNMYWQIGVTLRPGTARLEEDVTLFNATSSNHLYLFWSNAAVRATEDAQFIYPMREAIFDDPFAVVQSWPIWRGVDRSWHRNDPGALAIFGRNVKRNFFGVYYHKSNYGVVHVANYHQDPGKKFWTWGTAPSGTIWEHILSDSDGPYSEIQSGRFYTQGSREFMDPRRVEKWTEYWYPVRGLDGGYVEATPQMAINVVHREGRPSEVKLAISPAAIVRGTTITVTEEPASGLRASGADAVKRIRNVDLMPLETAVYTIPVATEENTRKNLAVDIQDARGRTILHWSAAEPVDGNPNLVNEVGKAIKKRIEVAPGTPIDELYLHGLFLEKTDDWRGAAKVYRQVLERDPGYVPALLKEAWSSYKAADFSQAESLLERAIDRDNGVNNDPAVPYALGVVERADGQFSRAEDAFWKAIHYGSALAPGPSLAPSFVELGEIAIRQRSYAQAAHLLRRAIAYNPGDAFAIADLAVAERLGGDARQAVRDAEEARERMPLLPYAAAEQWLSSGRPAGAGSDKESWTTIISSDPENYLAVAAWYHSLGAWKSSDKILEAAISNLPVAELSPMLDYYLAANAREEGNPAKAVEYGKKAATLPVEEVFPNRIADVAVLQEAIKRNPSDTHARYALGNFLFAHARYDDAARLWQTALAGGFDNAVLLRNLAVYEWRVKHDLEKAAGYYQSAILLNLADYRLYTKLDQVYELQGDTAAREALFRDAPARVLGHDTVRGRRAVLALEQSQPDVALGLLRDHTFKPWEGGVVIHQLYVYAYMEKGRAAFEADQLAQAAEDFKQAMLYPDALGTGRPPSPDLSEQQYWLGNVFEAEGKPEEARSLWNRAASRGSAFSALAYRKLGQSDKARAILEEKIHAAGRQGATAEEYAEAARAQRFSGNPSAARKLFCRALRMDPLLWRAGIEMRMLDRKVGSTAAGNS